MSDPDTSAAKLQQLGEKFDETIRQLGEARSFAKPTYAGRALDLAARLLALDGGAAFLYDRVAGYDQAGIFIESDWENLRSLRPRLTAGTFASNCQRLIAMECLSELRWLALAEGSYTHPEIAPEEAHDFLRKVLANNLDHVFQRQTEAARDRLARSVNRLFDFLVERLGVASILEQVVEEIYRMLRQRPVKIDKLRGMITQVSVTLATGDVNAPKGAERLISALYGPTHGCEEDPGLDVYRARMEAMDYGTLSQEAGSFSRAMHDTGLVSPYHAIFMQYILEFQPTLIPQALGLSSTGNDSLLCYQSLVHELIRQAITPETCRAVYGLSRLLERGILHMPPIAPALWRQIQLKLLPEVEAHIAQTFPHGPPPRVHLLAGVICLIGLPYGIGQGDNPTCQSARALSMWAYNDPDYLLQLLTWAARDGEIVMHFEGRAISSRDLQAGLVDALHMDLDAVSLVLVPHLDRIYMEMGRMAAGRGEDPHKWVNPEFHGWWVARGFKIAVDINTGNLMGFEDFIREFHASYHPYYNGNQPVIHPQPAGIAVTDSQGRFVGWHAITILRVALDLHHQMRVYFYNPNNDSGQDWGHGVVVSTEGCGEYYGESSLPFEEFTSRLYLFHYDPLERGDPGAVPGDAVARIIDLASQSWAADRLPRLEIPL